MIADLKPYPAMRDSGVPWLGQVPEHWSIVALRLRYHQCLGKMLDSKRLRGIAPLPYLRNVDVQWGRINSIDLPVMDIEQHEYERYCVRPGDLLVCEGGEVGRAAIWRGEIERCGFQKALHRLRPYSAATDSPRFLYYIFRCASSSGAFADGHESTIAHLTGDKLRAHRFVFPPFPEQAAIVRFLSHADRRIRRYIRAKQKLINLLEEQKQAIIHRAVTRGFDPNVRLEPSGVEWLGEVPEHWEVRQLRQFVAIVGGITPSMENRRFWDGTIPWVTPKDMKRASLGDSSVRVSEAAIRETSLRLLQPPAILMVVRGMILARRVPIACTTAPVTVNQDMKALIPVQGVNAEFLAALLGAAQDAFVPLIDEAGHGTRRLPTERWRTLGIALPPEHEQLAIVRFLNEATSSVVTAIDRAAREISLLREYRTRLIADVVTGKLDVREAAAGLPDEAEEPGALDELESLAEARKETPDDADTAPEGAEA